LLQKRLGDIYFVDPSRSEEDKKSEENTDHGILTVGYLPTSEQTNMVKVPIWVPNKYLHAYVEFFKIGFPRGKY